jgi:hypothetical protein
VAHACNPSYSGGRDQEDCSSKSPRANSSQDPISKEPITKQGWWSIGLEFKPQYSPHQKNLYDFRNIKYKLTHVREVDFISVMTPKTIQVVKFLFKNKEALSLRSNLEMFMRFTKIKREKN